jgi:Fuc2NAc and GlcNAc transferase
MRHAAVYTALGVGIASLLLTGLVRAYAIHREILDHPNRRSSHTTPTPRGGGAAILLAAIAGLLTGAWLGAVEDRHALTLAAGMAALGVTGWLDDARGVPAATRLMVHLAVACGTLAAFGGLPSLQIGSGVLPFGIVGYALGAIGIVWSINLFNFMDGIDGLAGSQAVLIFGMLSALLFARGSYSLAFTALVMAAATAGFVPWNWPPARIFMGDVGSGAVGYAITGIAIASENAGGVPLLATGIVGGVFIADATVTLIRRFRGGHGLAEAHRNHAYQRLSSAWKSHRSVTVAAAMTTAALGGLAALATMNVAFLLPSFIGAYAFLGALLAAVERRAPYEP